MPGLLMLFTFLTTLCGIVVMVALPGVNETDPFSIERLAIPSVFIVIVSSFLAGMSFLRMIDE